LYVLNNPVTKADPSGFQADLGVKPPADWSTLASQAGCSKTSLPLKWRKGSATAAPEGVMYSFVYALKGCCKDEAGANLDTGEGEYGLPDPKLGPSTLRILVYYNTWTGQKCDPLAESELRALAGGQKTNSTGFKTGVNPDLKSNSLGCVVTDPGTIRVGDPQAKNPGGCTTVTWGFGCAIYCLPGLKNAPPGDCCPGACSTNPGASGSSKANGMEREVLVVNWQAAFNNNNRCSINPCQVNTTVGQRFL
jgi:hypothetical protein